MDTPACRNTRQWKHSTLCENNHNCKLYSDNHQKSVKTAIALSWAFKDLWLELWLSELLNCMSQSFLKRVMRISYYNLFIALLFIVDCDILYLRMHETVACSLDIISICIFICAEHFREIWSKNVCFDKYGPFHVSIYSWLTGPLLMFILSHSCFRSTFVHRKIICVGISS